MLSSYLVPMKVPVFPLFLFLVTAILLPSDADEPALSPLERREREEFAKTEGDDVKTRETLDWAEKYWDTELNRIYRAITGRLKGNALDSMKTAQRKWIDFRDAEYLRLDALQEGVRGTMWNNPFRYAKMRITRERTLALERTLGIMDDSGY